MKTVPNLLSFLLTAVAITFAPVCVSLSAATTTTVASGLLAPTKVILSKQGNLLVAEAGIGPNTGRISLVDPTTGSRRSLLAGLPSGFAAPNNDPSGPSALLMRGRTLFVTIGTGDAVVNGAAPTTTVANPHPSSPVYSSVLAVHFSANVEKSTAGFTLSFADQVALKAGSLVVLDNGSGDKLTVELVADFDNYLPEPRPGEPNNVRASNPFDLAVIGERMFVVDASMNNVRTVDLASGAIGTLTTFAPLPNIRGFGPPVVEAVPNSLRVFGDQLLVTLLTGFPFPLGGAQVQIVDPDTGAHGPLITGLTSAIDVLPLDDGGFFALEFTSDMLAGVPPLPGKLKWFATPSSSPVVITGSLISPTNLERNEQTGALFVTEIFTGRILKITL